MQTATTPAPNQSAPVLADTYTHAGIRCRWSVTPRPDGWLYAHDCTREPLPRHLRLILSYEAGRAHGYGPSSDLTILHGGKSIVQRGEYLAALAEALLGDVPSSPLIRILSIDEDRSFA